MPSFLPYGNAVGLQIPRWQAFALKDYGFTLAALTLEPSDFCSNGVNTAEQMLTAGSATGSVAPLEF
jgi:hypothetical protein